MKVVKVMAAVIAFLLLVAVLVGAGCGSEGPAGPQGVQGPAGPQGVQGPQGPAGGAITSVVANPLPAGSTPTASFDATTGVLTLGIPMGATGAAGATGAKGDTGAKGATGATGPMGPAGPAGP